MSCVFRHWSVQLILSYSWARPAVLEAGKGRGGMFLFFLFLHCHSFSFLPVPLFHLLYYLLYLSSPFLWETTQNDPWGSFDLCLFGFVGFLFLLGSGKGCGLWLWHSLDFSLTFFWRVVSQLVFQFRRRSEKLIFKVAQWRPSWFPLKTILAILINKSPQSFLLSFESIDDAWQTFTDHSS